MNFAMGLGLTSIFSKKQSDDFSPLDVPDLKLWLDASDDTSIVLNGSDVSQWSDKSGNSEHFTQATAVNQPAYVDQLNGKNVITFNGTSHVLENNAISINQPGSIYMTIKMDAIPPGVAGYHFTPDWTFWYHGTTKQYVLTAGTQLTYNEDPPPLTLKVWTFFINGVSSSFERNGVELAAGNIGSDDMSGQWWLGAFVGVGGYLAAKMAEIEVYDRVLSSGEDTQVRSYLLNKWGVT